MKKNLFLRLCLTLLIALSAYSCRTDHFPETETYHNSSKFRLTSKRISLEEAKHKTQLITELNEAKNGFKKLSKSYANSRTVNFGDSIFINTDNVIYMENGPNYHTYTFSIQRSNPLPDAPVENLVLTPLPDGGYKAYLMTYTLTEEEKNVIISGGNVEVNNKAVVTPLEGNFSSALARVECSEYIYDYYTWCGEAKHNNGEICNSKDGVYSQHVVIIGIKCNGGNPMLPGNNPPEDGSGSGETGGAVPCSVNGVYTNPQDPANSSCNAGVVTLPNIIFAPPNSPCGKVKAMFAREKYKKKSDSINKNAFYTENHETGFREQKNGALEDLPKSGNDALNVVLTENTIGYTHVHLNDKYVTNPANPSEERLDIKIRMPSPADVNTLMEMADINKSTADFKDLYGVMLSSDGTYVIKFTGTAADINTSFGTTEAIKKKWREDFAEYFKENDKPSNETNFLKFLRDKMQVNGVSLFNVKSNGNVYEVKLNAAGTKAVSEKCSD